MQNKVISFILIGIGSLAILIFGYAIVFLKQSQATTNIETIVTTSKKIVLPTSTSPTPNQKPKTMDTLFDNLATFDNGTTITLESEGKFLNKDNSNTSYGLFIQKSNAEKKLLTGGISQFLLIEGKYVYVTTTNPNIDFLKFSWADSSYNVSHFYVIDRQNEKVLTINYNTIYPDYSEIRIPTLTATNSIKLSHLNECSTGSWQTNDFKCHINQQLIYNALEVDGKKVLPLKNLTSNCGPEGGFDDTCEVYLAPTLKITGVDQKLEKVYFQISQHTDTYPYIFNINTRSLTPGTKQPPISLTE